MKSRYTINFPEHMARCETNYVQLLKLMPNRDTLNTWEFAIGMPNGHWKMRFEVIERARYTTTVSVARQDNEEQAWLQLPTLTVRLYHDADIAEVLGWNKHKKFDVRYPYPNKQMYQCDEKAQLNSFLGEWLNLCLAQGHSLEKVSVNDL